VLDQWISNYKEKVAVYAELQYVNRNLETIIKRRTVELDKSNKELRSSLDVKNRMFSIIAHDLKSPIATLAQHANIIAELFPEGENSDLVFDFQRLTNSSIDLIDNLLFWGLKQTDKIQYKPEQINIDEIIDEISELSLAAAKNKNQTITLDITEPISAYCDASLLRICLRNLITNAIKFTPEFGVIEVSVRKEKDEIFITIVDNGVGIEDQIIKEILENQTQSNYGTSGEKGTGLGLMVVKDLVDLNKGRLDIKSKPGSGTSVSISLPGKP
jgi:signal transduction histidine kinase